MTTKRKTRNKFEKRIFDSLKLSGASFDYEGTKIPYTIEGNYLPDFAIETPTGYIYLETKGHFRPEAKRKMVAVKKCNPGLDIRIVFYSETKVNVRWALKHGFKFAFREIPKNWMEEFNGGT